MNSPNVNSSKSSVAKQLNLLSTLELEVEWDVMGVARCMGSFRDSLGPVRAHAS